MRYSSLPVGTEPGSPAVECLEDVGKDSRPLIDPSCTRLINGFMGGYCFPPSPGIVGEFGRTPLKNKYSHIHDALQYIFVKLFESQRRAEPENEVVRRKEREYNPIWD